MPEKKKTLIEQEDIWCTVTEDRQHKNTLQIPGEKETANKNVSLAIRYVKELEKQLDETKGILQKEETEKGTWLRKTEQCNVLSERITSLCRRMTIDVNKSVSSNGQLELDELLLSQYDVRIGYLSEGWFYFRIPALLPHKKKGHSWYLTGILWAAFDCWQRKLRDTGQTIKLFTEKCVIVYRTTYDRSFPCRRYTDYDNFEYKVVTDLIAGPLLTDDGPQYLSALYLTNTEGCDNYTEVFLLPERQLPVFYEQISRDKLGEIQYQFRSSVE